MSDTDDSVMMPCQQCGRELSGAPDGVEPVSAEVEQDFEFAGETATREVPGYRCPDCDEVTPL